jgi:hypothetical protein
MEVALPSRKMQSRQEIEIILQLEQRTRALDAGPECTIPILVINLSLAAAVQRAFRSRSGYARPRKQSVTADTLRPVCIFLRFVILGQERSQLFQQPFYLAIGLRAPHLKASENIPKVFLCVISPWRRLDSDKTPSGTADLRGRNAGCLHPPTIRMRHESHGTTCRLGKCTCCLIAPAAYFWPMVVTPFAAGWIRALSVREVSTHDEKACCFCVSLRCSRGTYIGLCA